MEHNFLGCGSGFHEAGVKQILVFVITMHDNDLVMTTCFRYTVAVLLKHVEPDFPYIRYTLKCYDYFEMKNIYSMH